MKAKKLYNEILSKIKGGYSVRVAINRARKHNLKDRYEEIFWYTGMSIKQGKEFIK